MASAATDWANKRRAQVLRAEQLKAQRKNGITDESSNFQPSLTKRPSYLSAHNAGSDSLDHLAKSSASNARGAYDPNDPMEAPLPGAKANLKIATNLAVLAGGIAQPISPNGDSLGKEMKRFPATPTRANAHSTNSHSALSTTRHANNDFAGASLGDVLGSRQQQAAAAQTYGTGITASPNNSTYRSKFMQQYENQTGQAYHAPAAIQPAAPTPQAQQPKPQDLADEAFMQTLRSASIATNTPGSRRDNKPGWNDDVVSSSPYSNGFGEPPAVKKREPAGRKAPAEQSEPGAGQRRRGSGAGLGMAGVASGIAAQGRLGLGLGAPAADWNADAAYRSAPTERERDSNAPRGAARRPVGADSSSNPQAAQESPRLPGRDVSPRLQDRDRDRDRERGEASGQGLGQARSRLSLLKLKMRQSESGGGSRIGLGLGSEHGRSGPNLHDYDEVSASAPYAPQPRTAPIGRRDEAQSAGGYLDEHRKRTQGGLGAQAPQPAQKDRSKPPPSSSRNQHQAYMQQQEDEAERSAREYRDEEERYRQSLRDRDSERDNRSLRDRERRDRWDSEPEGDPVGQRGAGPARSRPKAESRPQRQPPHASAGREDGGRERERERDTHAKPFRAPPGYHDQGDDENETGPYTPYAASGGQSGGAGDGDAPDPYESGPMGEQKECPDCGRRFNPLPYARHVKICAKVFVSKRKVFDSKMMRIQDNPELVKILKQTAAKGKKATKGQGAPVRERVGARKDADAFGGGGGFGGDEWGGGGGGMGGGGGVFPSDGHAKAKPRAAAAPSRTASPPVSSNSTAKWKQDSNAFRDAMRAARQVSKAIATGAPLPPPTYSAPDPSMMQCPTCGRRFNQKAGERHIPQCANIMNKPKSLMAHSGKAAVSSNTPAKAKQKRTF